MAQIWRTTCQFLFNGSINMENVHHYSISPDPSSAQLILLTEMLCLSWEYWLESDMSSDLVYSGNWFRRVDVPSLPAY